MSGTGRVVVVGLGPGSTDLLLPAARRVLESSAHRYVRTARHPAVAALEAEGLTFLAFDALYDAETSIDAVYEGITAALVDAASRHGSVIYAVPGSPVVAERTTELLRAHADAGRIELELVPGLSFAELAWARAGVDPLQGGHVVDARTVTVETFDPGGPFLVAQCDTRLLLSDVKLVLLGCVDATTPVTVLQRLGSPDELVWTVALEDLDRVVEPDHLTAVLVRVDAPSVSTELLRLLALATRLRAPGGCPWDAEQTHHSLTRYLLEESYEVVDAVELLPPDAPDGMRAGDPRYDALVDELGDLLYQVVFHVVLAEEVDAFTMADVARGIHDKLVRRHPHVFGDVVAETSSAVMTNWEQIKKEEKGVASIVDGISPGLPSLLYTHKLLRKSASVGLDSGSRGDATARIEQAALAAREPGADVEALLGEILAASVALARSSGVDAESALRHWAARFRTRFEAMEELAVSRGLDLHRLDTVAVAALWNEAAAGLRTT